MQPGSGLRILELEQDVSVSGVSLSYDEYRYEPLITEDAVRVLVVEPADHFDSPLCCSITQHQRDPQSRSVSGCEYSAVSYTWGGSELSHQLLVRSDAQSWSYLQITANVDSLLRHFRASHKARLFWIDAICLNQKDETEKTQQIPLMGRIYHDAKRVRIWLGDDEVAKAQHAFALIREIERDDQRRLTEEETQCLAEFFSRPWFTRRWVIQEAVFSHDGAFHCGTYKLSLSRVMAALRKMNRAVSHELIGYGARMLLMSIGSRHFEKKGLLSLLWDLHYSECSDPRDRIAAVYALVTDEMRPQLHYGSRDWKELYMDVASYFINTLPAFDSGKDAASVHTVLLHLYCFGPVKSQTDADGPSWVPDWSRRRRSSIPHAPDDLTLYYCVDFCPSVESFNFPQVDIERHRTQRSTTEYRTSYRERMELLASLKLEGPACMKTEVIGQTLRLNYHPLIFFQQCGKVDLVINCSTAPGLWRQVFDSLEIATILQHKSAETSISETYNFDTCLSDQDSLLGLLCRILIERDSAVTGISKSLESYSEEIREELHACRDDPGALGASHRTKFHYISTSLRRQSIIRIQASTRSYWVIGPPVSQVGDWIVPLVLSSPERFVPAMCLRPNYPEGAEVREPQRVSHATSTKQRCTRYLGGSIAEADCLHVETKFVGPAGHWDGAPVLFEGVPVDYEMVDDEKMWDTIMNATEVARGKGLPGPMVFDVV